MSTSVISLFAESDENVECSPPEDGRCDHPTNRQTDAISVLLAGRSLLSRLGSDPTPPLGFWLRCQLLAMPSFKAKQSNAAAGIPQSMDEKKFIRRELRFDLKSMRERACVGVRRAAAFLGLSERLMEKDMPRSLTLGGNVKLQFLPDPYPDDGLPVLRENWRAWIIGNALRELDQFLSLFLDEAYDVVQQSKIMSGENSADHKWKRIVGKTNAAEKHKLVLENAGQNMEDHIDEHGCLVSLSQVRNCLSHDLGVVTPKRTFNGELCVRWIAIRTMIQQGGRIFDMDAVELPFHLDPDGPHGIVFAKVELAERKFAIGNQIRFTPDELLGICLFYQIVIDRVSQAVQNYAEDCGVVFDRP